MLARPLGDELDKLNDAVQRITKPGNIEKLNDLWFKGFSKIGISRVGTDLHDAEQVVKDFNAAIVELAKTDPTAAGEAYAAVLRQLVSEGVPARDAMEQLRDARRAVFEGNLATGGVTGPIEEIEDAAAAADQAVSDLKSALDELFIGPVSLRQAADEVATAINSLTTQFVENGGAIRGNTQDAIDNRAAVDAVAAAMAEEIGVMGEAGASAEDMNAKNASNIATLQALAVMFPQLRPFIEDHIAALEGVPAAVATTITANDLTGPTMSEAERRLTAWNESRGTAQVDADNENARVRIAASKDDLFDWNVSEGTADVKADKSVADAMMAAAERRRTAWGASSASANINANDRASGVISAVRDMLDRLNGKTATTYIVTREQRISSGPGGSGGTPQRYGGVWQAQTGLAWDARMLSAPTIFAGERATGGEAFIPKRGNPNRSLRILSEAASWYGMEMRPTAGSGSGVTINHNDLRTLVTVDVRAKGSITDKKGLVGEIRRVVQGELDDQNRKLARGLLSR
jgi:hypothetical protein